MAGRLLGEATGEVSGGFWKAREGVGLGARPRAQSGPFPGTHKQPRGAFPTDSLGGIPEPVVRPRGQQDSGWDC